MSIKRIIIKNFRSIESMELDFTKEKNITCFLGKNGVGKSNIFLALKYFYDNLDDLHIEDVIDKQNPYNSYCEISIIYDLQEFDVKVSNDYLRVFFADLCDKAKECKKSIPLNNLKKNLIKVSFRQDKEGQIRWNQTINLRKQIKKIFPFYYINTRKLDLITWEKIWEIIGDLATDMPGKNEIEINEELDSAFSKIYPKKYESSKKIIEKAFKDNNISLDKYHFESRFKYMFMTRFNGESFINDGHSLDYYSDGLNSYTYIVMLISLINQISNVSCKSPIVVLDEPEIGLHESKIEDLINCICESVPDKSFLLINTHSPKVICELIRNELDIDIYRLYLFQWNTKCKKLNTQFLLDQRHIITTLETSCYFSDYLVFVEGESEFQLLNDKHLKELFPFLKRIKVYALNSNEKKLDYVLPKYLNIGIPYVVIYDIDKIISFNKVKNQNYYKATIQKSRTNPLGKSSFSKESLFSFFKTRETKTKKLLFSNLETLLDTKFFYKTNFNYVEQKEYIQMIQTIKGLCLFDNYLINNSTIEGELVCKSNVDVFLDYCVEKNEKERDINKLKSIPDLDEKAALTRLFLDGKLDLGDKKIVCESFGFKQKSKVIDSKASGWINEWLTYFWDNYLSVTDKKVDCFKDYFPSLYNTLQYIENML